MTKTATGGPVATLTYLGYRTGSALAGALPELLGRPAATLGGRALGLVMRGRRQMIARHLRRIYGPDLTGKALNRAVAEVFESYGHYWLEIFRLPHLTPASLDARFEVDGLDHLDGAMAKGRGAILASPHVGNFDLAGAWFATHGYRPATVMEPIEPPALFHWFVALRAKVGVEAVALGPEAIGAMARALGQGRMIGLICDRDLPRTGIEVDFFGERTTFPAGPAILGLRTGAAILPSADYPSSDRRRQHRLLVRPPLDVTRRGSFREDVARITQMLAREHELLIRRAPEQWHLLQPNWPSDYALARKEPA